MPKKITTENLYINFIIAKNEPTRIAPATAKKRS